MPSYMGMHLRGRSGVCLLSVSPGRKTDQGIRERERVRERVRESESPPSRQPRLVHLPVSPPLLRSFQPAPQQLQSQRAIVHGGMGGA